MDDTQIAFSPSTDDTSNALSTADVRAKRLRTLRTMAGLTREELCQPINILDNMYLAPEILRAWELGHYGGLPEDGAKQLAILFSRVGVTCTAEWLLFGAGVAPQGNNFIYLPLAV